MENARLTHTRTINKMKFKTNSFAPFSNRLVSIRSSSSLRSGCNRIGNFTNSQYHDRQIHAEFNYTLCISIWIERAIFAFRLNGMCVCILFLYVSAHKRLFCVRNGAAFRVCDLRIFEKKLKYIEFWVFSQLKFKLKLCCVIFHCVSIVRSVACSFAMVDGIFMMYREFFPRRCIWPWACTRSQHIAAYALSVRTRQRAQHVL